MNSLNYENKQKMYSYTKKALCVDIRMLLLYEMWCPLSC